MLARCHMRLTCSPGKLVGAAKEHLPVGSLRAAFSLFCMFAIVERAREPLDKELVVALGLAEHRFLPDLPVTAGFLDSPEIDCGRFDPVGKQAVKLAAGQTRAIHVGLRAEQLPRGAYDLIHIVERDARTEDVIGGVSLAIVDRES